MKQDERKICCQADIKMTLLLSGQRRRHESSATITDLTTQYNPRYVKARSRFQVNKESPHPVIPATYSIYVFHIGIPHVRQVKDIQAQFISLLLGSHVEYSGQHLRAVCR